MLNPRNTVNITGGLTRDPELVNDGKIMKLGLAIDWSGKDANDPDNHTGYFDIVLFNSPELKWAFDQVDKGSLKKGSQIQVLGRINHDRFTNSEGTKTSRVNIIAESIAYTGSAPRTEAENGSSRETVTIPSNF